jgi:hypothetical protein
MISELGLLKVVCGCHPPNFEKHKKKKMKKKEEGKEERDLSKVDEKWNESGGLVGQAHGRNPVLKQVGWPLRAM